MPAQFPIVSIISTSKKKKGAMQVIVDFNGTRVTRHILNGVGKHPDDNIPAVHKRLRENLEENVRLRQDKRNAIALLQQAPPKNLKPAQVVELLAKLAEEIRVLDTAKPTLEEAIRHMNQEDPLMVRYVLA